MQTLQNTVVEERETVRPGGVMEWACGLWRKGLARAAGVRGEREMQVLERLELGGRRQLYLVRCGRQRYLVGAGGDGVTAIVPANAGGNSELQAETR